MARRVPQPSNFALYHMEEATHGALLSLVDTKGGRTLSSGSSVTCPRSGNAINSLGAQVRYARVCNGTTGSEMDRPGSAGALAIAGGTHTQEYIFRVDALGSRQVIFAYGRTAAASNARNFQFQFAITSTGQLAQRWERGAGVIEDAITTTPGMQVTTGRWYYACCVLTRSATPLASSVAFYLRAVDSPTMNTETITGLTQPDGGTAVEVSWRFGYNGITTGASKDYFTGSVACIAVSNAGVTRTDQVARAAAALDGTMKFADDTDTADLWLCNEQPDLIDEIGGLHGQVSNVTASFIAPGVQNVAGVNVSGKYWTGSATSLRLQTAAGPAVRPTALNALLKTSFTVALEFRESDDNQPATTGLVAFGDPTDAASAQNCFAIGVTSTGATIQTRVEHGANVAETATATNAIATTALQKSVHHLVVSVELLPGGTQQRVRTWLNGVLINTTDVTTYDGGAEGRLTLGQGTNATTTWRGVIGALVIDSFAWDQEDVDADLEQITESDGSAPVIENLVYPEEPMDFLEFDAWDEESDWSLLSVLIQMGNAQGGEGHEARDVIYDEGAFRGSYYGGGSTVTGAGTSGDKYHFKIRPAGGWPTLPSGQYHILLPRFTDGGGNLQIGPEF